MHTALSLALVLLGSPAAALLAAGDPPVDPINEGGEWSTYRADPARSGRVDVDLDVARLEEAWVWRGAEPRPAWPGPARWDAYAKLPDLPSMRAYDLVSHPVVAGGKVLLASSADDTVRALDAETGEVEWTAHVGGPVRVAPTVHEGLVLFGCDDGLVRCVNLHDGALLWTHEPVPGARRLIASGRISSQWPVRTGVVVKEGRAYFGASLLPWEQSVLCAVDATTGRLGSAGTWRRELGTGWTLEGALLASQEHLVLPQGRVPPLVFERGSGAPLGSLGGGGGSFALLTEEGDVLHGPGNKTGWISDSSAESRERLASYERGRALVLDELTTFLVTPGSIVALDRSSRSILWSVPAEGRLEIVLAGDVLLLGAPRLVEARSKSDGKLLWQAEVEGQAHGLAVTGERLVVSTDTGATYCFSTTGEPRAAPVEVLASAPSLSPPAEIDESRLRGVVDRFVFQENGLARLPLEGAERDDPRRVLRARNLARADLPAQPLAQPSIAEAGELQAHELDGRTNDWLITDDLAVADLPERALSAEAWVRVDQAQEWGGILAATQDNGEFERGWILGFRKNRLGFALKTEKQARLTWLLAPVGFELGAWHHVVGTWDGRRQRLYIDGVEVAESSVQAGPIHYPERAFYCVGAYRDDDEYFRMRGAVHEVALYDRALTGRDVERRWKAKVSRLPRGAAPRVVPALDRTPRITRGGEGELAWGPLLRFTERGTCEVSCGTRADEQLVALLRRHGDEEERVLPLQPGPRSEHTLRLEELAPRTTYRVRFHLAARPGQPARTTREYEVDTHFDANSTDLALEPDRSDALARDAEDVLGPESARAAGFAVVFGGNDAFACALARQSTLQVIVAAEVDDDAELQARRARIREREAGHWPSGVPISVLAVGSDGELRLPRAFANHVVETGPSRARERGALELLRPDGGRFSYLDESFAASEAGLLDHRRDEQARFQSAAAPQLEGAASWTHMYGSADNSAFAGEALAGARSIEDLDVQWLGPPGPRYQSDRGNRKPSPLASNGRLLLQGLHRIIALDAHNGAWLWNWELPELARFNVPRSSRNWCVDEDTLFVAIADRVQPFDAADGELRSPLRLSELGLEPEGAEHEWGWIARGGELLFGSVVPEGAQFTDWWGGEHWYDSKDGEHASKVSSVGLFAVEASTGELRWVRSRVGSQADGQLGRPLDVTLSLSGDRLYFVETRAEKMLAAGGRLSGSELWSDLWLMCLDAKSGEVIWEREARPEPGETAFYLAAGEDARGETHLVMESSGKGSFSLYVFDAETGKSEWRKKFAWEADHHGKHLARPAIVRGRLLVRPMTFQLETGEVLASAFPEGHQCGSYACSDNAVFLRAGDMTMWDVEGGSDSRFTRLRPDCWVSTIPALGMLLSPEGGGGCSCGSWIETSIGFLPTAARFEEGSR